MLSYTPKHAVDGVEFDLQKVDGKHYFYITGYFDNVTENKHKLLRFRKGKKLKDDIRDEVRYVKDQYEDVKIFYTLSDVNARKNYEMIGIHNKSFKKMSKKEKAGLGIVWGGFGSVLIGAIYWPLAWVLFPVGLITSVIGKQVNKNARVSRQFKNEKYMIRRY